jgi:release factor glutamine methyltransferase
MPVAGRTRAQALGALVETFVAAGVDTPSEDARLLLRAACGLSRLDLATAPDAPLTEADEIRLASYALRRANREPVSRILGARGFWDLDLAVTPEVLDPRADTETLVESVLRLCADTPPETILDLGSGSGAIVCALLGAWPQARAVAVDLSPHACRATMRNLAQNNLGDRTFVLRGCWGDALAAGRFDLIVSNPPYIASGDLAGLDPEVRLYDPALALDGGADGLGAYREIIRDLTRLAAPGAHALFEVGAGQANDVAALLSAQGLDLLGVARDLGGHERVVAARVPAAPSCPRAEDL